jgi:hypothetical protein
VAPETGEIGGTKRPGEHVPKALPARTWPKPSRQIPGK